MHIMLEKKYVHPADLEEHQRDEDITGQNNTKKSKMFLTKYLYHSNDG